MWVARNQRRLQREWKDDHLVVARQTFGPRLSFERLAEVPYKDFKTGVRAFERGGKPFQTFRNSSRASIISSASTASLPNPYEPASPVGFGALRTSASRSTLGSSRGCPCCIKTSRICSRLYGKSSLCPWQSGKRAIRAR